MKTNVRMESLLAGLLLLLFSACISPQDNFKEHMKANVGMKIDDPSGANWAIPKYLLGSKSLLNGNVENEYEYRGTCRYFSSLIHRHA